MGTDLDLQNLTLLQILRTKSVDPRLYKCLGRITDFLRFRGIGDSILG